MTNPRLRSSLASSFRDVYEQYVDVLVALYRQQPDKGFDARALEALRQPIESGTVVVTRAAFSVRYPAQ